MKYLIVANFHVFVPSHIEGRPEVKQTFGRGQVVNESDIPEGQTGESWVTKGLATVAEAT